MQHKFWILLVCLGLLVPSMATAQSAQSRRDPDQRDLHGISANHHKYFFSVLGGTAVGAGLGFILPGSKTPLKLAMIGGGGVSSWYLHTHRRELGSFHDMGFILSNTAWAGGAGWLICNCNDGLLGGTLIGGGATAVWEALKNDRAARNTFDRTRNRASSRNKDRTRASAEKNDQKADNNDQK